jgi:hypothetical protein
MEKIRVYWTISGYVDIDSEGGEEACDKIEAMPIPELIERSKVAEVECEY